MNGPKTFLRLLLAAGIVASTAVTVSACSESFQGSCDWRPAGNNRCFDYTSAYKQAQQNCDGRKVWSPKPCDLAGAIGGCSTGQGTTKWLWPNEKVKTKADAQVMECTSDWLDPVRK
jgi:hypothetical protein